MLLAFFYMWTDLNLNHRYKFMSLGCCFGGKHEILIAPNL
jgi:hypothetical protein